MKEKFAKASEMLKSRRETLFSNFLKGDGQNFLALNARALDDYFCQSFEQSSVGPKIGISKNPYAIIALGGYGREEQCLHSDVDLLLLFQKHIPDEAEELVREVIYPLWDIRLEIGHATRTLKECINLASDDFEVLTSLLDARFICGMSPLYTELMRRLDVKVLKKSSGKIINWLIERNRTRHERFGDSAHLLEPNLKEGQGGLRDYHTMLWIARIRSNLKQRRDLEFLGYLSHDEYRELDQALSFVWSVRNRIHHMVGRKWDQLLFKYQIPLADTLEFRKKNGLEPVEQLMGKLHGQMEFVKQLHEIFLYELENATPNRLKRRIMKNTSVAGIEIRKGMLFFESPEAVLKNPILLLHIFEESAYLKIPLSGEARRLVKDMGHLVDERLASSKAAVKSFERILLEPAPAFDVLNAMLGTGILERLVPEFRGIVNRIQYDEYHVHPVDQHLLKTVQTIKKFGTSQDPTDSSLCGDIYKELLDRKLLLWSALLHDIGKSIPEQGHSERGEKIARSIMEKKGYSPEAVEKVAFLVREHLLLFKTATRRDINDEETAVFAARRIQEPDRLKMLYLLSIADSIATGPKAWNEWTASLITELFLKILRILERGELATSEAIEIQEQKRVDILSSAKTADERASLDILYNFMSPRYLLSTHRDDILFHIDLFRRKKGSPFVWEVVKAQDMNARIVTICADDAPGLISKIAGVFTLNGIDILDVQVFTWRNNTALDVFIVKPPADRVFEMERWRKAEESLSSVLVGELDLREMLKDKIEQNRKAKKNLSGKPSRVRIDNESSSFFTIIEVFTEDFPGLLYSITDALFRCRLDIWVAKIATKVDQVVDVFYVRDFDGQKVDAREQETQIKNTVMEVLKERLVDQ
jgi:[protein-PII] uridylyltransferase